jgi:2-oxoisovalerate dehydrogenase E2 component (dihydrolipoyl transacylase)
MERTFVLPDLGEGLEEAEVSRWLVNEGDRVTLNQPFAEIETAKATVEIPAPYAGRIVKLHAAVGDTVKVGAPLVTFEVEGSDQNGGGAERPRGSEASRQASRRSEAPPGTSGAAAERAAATPAVRRYAKDLGLDISTIEGTGSEGRVTRDDVERAASSAPEDVEIVPVSLVRRTIAENLTKAAAVPHVTTFRTVDCTALEEARIELGVSPLPVFVRALVETVTTHPLMNAEWRGEGIRQHHRVDVGIAVDTERGLVVPVVRDARSRGIGEIAGEISRLASAAREGTLAPGDAAGATISVSNTGSYGSEYGTPLLNPPNAVTIALGAIAPRALVVDERVEARPACTLSCTFDHRVLDGADVGRALTDLVALLQDGDRLRNLTR